MTRGSPLAMRAASPEADIIGASSSTAAVAPVLVLDAASGTSFVAITDGLATLAEQSDSEPGAATERLPGLVAAVLASAGLTPTGLAAVAVTIGPGSFTGLRAALALAHGLACGAGLPLIGVGVGEAIRASIVSPDGRPVWVALNSRRSRIFLDRAGHVKAFAIADLPSSTTPITVSGDAAGIVVALLSSRGADVTLDPATRAGAQGIAAVARLRLSGHIPSIDAMPLYIDPPEAKLPAGGLRPAPV